jgi:hypothetical protein
VKLVVLVLGAYARPYPALLRTIRRTWASDRVEGVETLFYYGGPKLEVDGDSLVLPAPDALPASQKTIACFDYLLRNREVDLIFRTNASSYVDQSNLLAYANALEDPHAFYGGMLGYRGEMPFASGSGYFLGRDLMRLAVDGRDRWWDKIADDQSLAHVLAEHGVTPVETRRQDFEHVPRLDEVDMTQFHIRCRTDSFRRRRDRKIMRQVHEAFVRSRS